MILITAIAVVHSHKEQGGTALKFWDFFNQIAPKKKKKNSKEQDYQNNMQKMMKIKYKVAEVKKYLEDVPNALDGGFN
ncbi:hypothetical protein DSO57_1026127 [Entomophthora muscae]|uniref:Uncharacterized protein n=1 Tax=Entomophthora muscae TaxID=34485 RepID=A0ACC2TZZ6_9FUNG|nr:hypothetical protein DSO57_1026127 [Entomophthora muscae]